MIRIAIAEDNEDFIKNTEKIIRKYYQEKNIHASIEMFTNSEMLYFDLDEHKKYDLYLLDIDMPKVNGMQLARKIRSYDMESHIIFLTSHLKYSIVGYEYRIFRYIPKQSAEEKLIPALESVTQEIMLREGDSYVITTNSKYMKVPYGEMIYIYKDGKNSVLICEANTYKVRKSLKQVYDEIDSKQFIFVERGYIVNIIKISKVIGSEVYLVNGEVLHVGGSYLKEVKIKISEFWR